MLEPIVAFLFFCYGLTSATTCTYQDEVYGDGDTVNTSEPCLNCTCISGVLLCYLRVCTTVLPSPSGCVAEKLPGNCCPRTVCNSKEGDVSAFNKSQDSIPQVQLKSNISGSTVWTIETKPTVSSDLLTTTGLQNQTNVFITSTSSLGYNDFEGGCYLNGSLYAEGSAMMSPSFCHYCYCIRGKQVCLQPKCHLIIEGCKARYLSEFTCCPTHYDCEDGDANTTEIVSTSHSLPTTTPSTESGCSTDGFTYSVGDAMPSTGECKTCYCSRDGIKCSPLQCSPVMDGCVPIIPEGHCCPVQYTCNFTQYPSKHSFENNTWGVGEIQEITAPSINKTDNTTAEVFQTDEFLPTSLSSFFSTLSSLEIQSYWNKLDDKKEDSFRVQNEANSMSTLETNESTKITTFDTDIKTKQQEPTTAITDVIDETGITESIITFVPTKYHKIAIQKNTDSEDSSETPNTTGNIFTIGTLAEDVENTTEFINNINFTVTSVEEDTEVTPIEINQTIDNTTLAEPNPLESSTEGKRFRLEDPTRHLPPPFLFLGTRLAVRPVPLGGPTRIPLPRATQTPHRTNTAPIQGTCAIEGRIFMNGELVIHADPCEICRCISGREICHRQKCLPPPSADCQRERSPGFCCPHYICINPPPFDLQATPTRHKTPGGVSDEHETSVRIPVGYKPPEKIASQHNTQIRIPVENKPLERIPVGNTPVRISDEHRIPSVTPTIFTTITETTEEVQGAPNIIPYGHVISGINPNEPVIVPVTSEQKLIHRLATPTLSDHSITNETEEETTTMESRTTYIDLTAKASTTTFRPTPLLKVNTPSRLSFLDHLLSLMGSNTTNITQRPIPQNAVPGSLVGNSWGVLRVSGCNVYGRYYILHERIPQLSTDCKICICDSTGVNCNSIC